MNTKLKVTTKTIGILQSKSSLKADRDLPIPPEPQPLEISAISRTYAIQVLQDIAALEPQDVRVFKTVFDNMHEEELESFMTVTQIIRRLVNSYKAEIVSKSTEAMERNNKRRRELRAKNKEFGVTNKSRALKATTNSTSKEKS